MMAYFEKSKAQNRKFEMRKIGNMRIYYNKQEEKK